MFFATSQAKTLIAVYWSPSYKCQWIGVKAIIISYVIHLSKTKQAIILDYTMFISTSHIIRTYQMT